MTATARPRERHTPERPVAAMSPAERNANLAGVVVPFLGVLAAIVLLWNSWVDWTDIAIMVVMYLLTAVGVTVGFHRMLTHRAFQTYPWLERTFAVLGSLSVQGSVMDWVADHRKHHAHTDVEGDPHSPHVGHGERLQRLLARPRRLADGDPGTGRLAASTPRISTRIRRCAGSAACSRWLALLSLLVPDPRRLRAAVASPLEGRARGLHLGRAGADLLRAPRDLVGQLDLPHLRAPPL